MLKLLYRAPDIIVGWVGPFIYLLPSVVSVTGEKVLSISRLLCLLVLCVLRGKLLFASGTKFGYILHSSGCFRYFCFTSCVIGISGNIRGFQLFISTICVSVHVDK